METTYLLIEVTRNITIANHIEDIHGVSASVETLKEVALEENGNEPLEWKTTLISRIPYANRTTGNGVKREFFIIRTNDYDKF